MIFGSFFGLLDLIRLRMHTDRFLAARCEEELFFFAQFHCKCHRSTKCHLILSRKRSVQLMHKETCYFHPKSHPNVYTSNWLQANVIVAYTTLFHTDSDIQCCAVHQNGFRVEKRPSDELSIRIKTHLTEMSQVIEQRSAKQNKTKRNESKRRKKKINNEK